MLIDFHTHCFPEKIAVRAMEKLSFASGGAIPYHNGSFLDLKNLMDKSGVDKFAVMNIATNVHQQKAVNDFAANLKSDNVYPFGSVHPDAPDALQELERIKELGLKGVKFHPEYQEFYVDDPKMEKIYKKISELGLITVFHAGYDPGFGPESKCLPHNFVNALKHFSSPVILAHWGGVSCWTEVLKELCGLDVYFDTSFGYLTLPRPVAIKMIEKHGVNKFIFASDAPWHTPELEKRYLSTLGLTDSELQKIYSENALKLLKERL